ncbi:Phospholipid-binding protein [hydrothermal vent metagenome]|uniref:Phospholipid-binding protein n=1 Tax=hydrothermal vent metagenome TaxID=652676 RepID=A0A3B0VFC4_9ZZZZ
MKRTIVTVTLAMFIFFLSRAPARAAGFTLSSPQLVPGARLSDEQVYNGFGCTGKNISPELAWQGEPAGTKSFAVTVYDPDAPTGSGWWHWVIFNIPATVHRLARDAGNIETATAPAGAIQSRTDYGKPGYGGACPPAGAKAHRYQFTVYALDTARLPLAPDTPPAMVVFYLHQHELNKAGITVYYQR